MPINKVTIPMTELSDPPSYQYQTDKQWHKLDMFLCLKK